MTTPIDLGPCPHCGKEHEGLCPRIADARTHDVRERAGLVRYVPAPVDDEVLVLTKQDIDRMRQRTKCPLCGGIHGGLCRRVAEVEYYPDTGAQGMAGIKWARLRDEWDDSNTVYEYQLNEWEQRLRDMGKW